MNSMLLIVCNQRNSLLPSRGIEHVACGMPVGSSLPPLLKVSRGSRSCSFAGHVHHCYQPELACTTAAPVLPTLCRACMCVLRLPHPCVLAMLFTVPAVALVNWPQIIHQSTIYGHQPDSQTDVPSSGHPRPPTRQQNSATLSTGHPRPPVGQPDRTRLPCQRATRGRQLDRDRTRLLLSTGHPRPPTGLQPNDTRLPCHRATRGQHQTEPACLVYGSPAPPDRTTAESTGHPRPPF